MLWNVDTLLVHFLDEQILAVRVETIGDWRIRIDTTDDRMWLAVVYYLGKLDHLLCVPAMGCLLIGLRHMLKEIDTGIPGEGNHP